MTDGEPGIGVGPWPGRWPSGPEAARYDAQLLTEGDRRNVADHYRYWRHEAIVADLDTRRHELHIAVENWSHDFNIGSVIRTANAMNVAAFHIVGRRRWNRRGAMVTDRYQHEYHHADVAALVAWAASQAAGPSAGPPAGAAATPASAVVPPAGSVAPPAGAPRRTGLPLLAIDNVPGSVPLETYELPRRCLMIFGQEGPGLSDEALAAADAVLHITQFGSTRSINAGAAAAIAMHAWVRRHAFGQRVDSPHR